MSSDQTKQHTWRQVVFSYAVGHLKVLVEHVAEGEGDVLRRLVRSPFSINPKYSSSHLEINNRSRGLIIKFIFSVGDYRVTGISKFKVNAT